MLDIRFAPPTTPSADGEVVLTLDELAARARSPRRLAALLWSRPWGVVRVIRDPLPLSGVQAGAVALVALARARRFELGGRRTHRVPFLARAATNLAIALPRELGLSAVLYLRASRIARRTAHPGSLSSTVRRVTYLRPHPTLNWMGSYVGGAAAHTTGVINGLLANGIDVHVFAPERPAGIDDGAAVTTVPLQRPLHLVQWLTMTGYSDAIVRAAVSDRPDFVYQRYTLGSFAGAELARSQRVPLVLEYNGSEVWAIRHWGSGRVPFDRTLVALEEHNLAAASLIVVVSQVLKDELVERGVAPDRVLVNPNGVDVWRLEHFAERTPAEWRAATGQPEAPTIGFVGTFGLWHGVKVLPPVIEAVAAERPSARWIVIGDGRLFDDVRADVKARGLENRTLLSGVVPHERTLELLAACDICISPHVPNPDGTRFFGSPTKVFEYMGLGKPIVASDLEQIGEVLEHERTALLVPPGDVAATAAAVVRLLDDEDLGERLGAAAADEARRKYGWDLHVRRILDALASV
jgi:glycosyltransferase involved in cell wall biosynthesis